MSERARTAAERAAMISEVGRLHEELAWIDQEVSDDQDHALKQLFTNALGALGDLRRELHEPPPAAAPRLPRPPSPKKALEAEMDELEARWKLPAPAALLLVFGLVGTAQATEPQENTEYMRPPPAWLMRLEVPRKWVVKGPPAFNPWAAVVGAAAAWGTWSPPGSRPRLPQCEDDSARIGATGEKSPPPPPPPPPPTTTSIPLRVQARILWLTVALLARQSWERVTDSGPDGNDHGERLRACERNIDRCGEAAAYLDRRCRNRSDGGACLNLALLVRAGRGVPRDQVQEHQLYYRACILGDTLGCRLGEPPSADIAIPTCPPSAPRPDCFQASPRPVPVPTGPR